MSLSGCPTKRRVAPQRLLVLATVLVATVAPGMARADHPPQDARALPGRALVRFEPGIDGAARSAVHAAAGARAVASIGDSWEAVSFPASVAIDSVVAAYRSLPGVSAAEPDLEARTAITPSDSCLVACEGIAGQWHLALTNAAEAWNTFPGRTFAAADKLATDPITIAVLDTKIDATHPDFANAGGGTDAGGGGQLVLDGARDWVPPERWVGSIDWHGTFVAGLAAAATGNRADAAGIGYAAQILPLTVLDGGGRGDAASVADAILDAWEQGARVINLSIGLSGDSDAVHDAIRAVTTGTAARPPSLIVAAAGNNTGSTPFYPGSYPEVLSVSATDADDRHAPCSNYNANVAVAAPGDRLVGLAQMPKRQMQAPCGTSAAAPQVSGLAALLLMQDPARTPAQVRDLIERTADDLGDAGRDDRFGHGRINAARALRETGPRTGGARATIPPAAGGPSEVTAIARSSRGVRAAQVAFDRPNASPVAMVPVDGSWGGATETVRATVQVPAGLGAGPHPAWVRAFDGTTWGASTIAVVPVDTRAPDVVDARASDGVRAAARPFTVSFTATDDRSPTVSYALQFYATATNRFIAEVTRLNRPAGVQVYEWLPGLDAPAGHVSVTIIVADTAANRTRKVAGAVLA